MSVQLVDASHRNGPVENRLFPYSSENLQKQLYILRLLRLLPSEVAPLLICSASKLYECLYLDSPLSSLCAQRGDVETQGSALIDVQLFLDFEASLAHSPRYPNSDSECELLNEYLKSSAMHSRRSGTSTQSFLIEKTGSYLPSADMVSRAADVLGWIRHADSESVQHLTSEGIQSFVHDGTNVENEAWHQWKVTKELCEQIDAGSREHANRVLLDMDPKIVRPIMTQQANVIVAMSTEELQRNLYKELKLAMVHGKLAE